MLVWKTLTGSVAPYSWTTGIGVAMMMSENLEPSEAHCMQSISFVTLELHLLPTQSNCMDMVKIVCYSRLCSQDLCETTHVSSSGFWQAADEQSHGTDIIDWRSDMLLCCVFTSTTKKPMHEDRETCYFYWNLTKHMESSSHKLASQSRFLSNPFMAK